MAAAEEIEFVLPALPAADPPPSDDGSEADDPEIPPVLVVIPDVGADLPGYVPTAADLLLDSVLGDHVHDNDGTHLDGGIANDRFWQKRWMRIAQLATTRYQVPKGKVGRRFLSIFVNEFQGVRERDAGTRNDPSCLSPPSFRQHQGSVG